MSLDDENLAGVHIPSNLCPSSGLSLSQPQDMWKRLSMLNGRPESPIHFKHPASRITTDIPPPKPPRKITTNTALKKRELYRHQTDWIVSNIAWSTKGGLSFQLALSSFMEKYENYVQIISLEKDDHEEQFRSDITFQHSYPPTKILWQPKSLGYSRDNSSQLLATSSDNLRIWSLEEAFRIVDNTDSNSETTHRISPGVSSRQNMTSSSRVDLACELRPNAEYKHSAPMTSFDWNTIDPKIIVTTSVDAICTIWDLTSSQQISNTRREIRGSMRNQLIAHNKEIFDVSFTKLGSGRECFVTAGGDGAVRLFDTRKLASSTTLYETDWPSGQRAFVRVACNKVDPNLVSTFVIDSNSVIILDVRKPGIPVITLNTHQARVNSMSWAPQSAHHLCTGSDDQQALIWELADPSIQEPLLAYRASGRINVANWSPSNPDWIAIGYENFVEMLRV